MPLTKTLAFLNQLIPNNNREWFNENKALYLAARAEFEQAVEEWLPMIRALDSDIDVLEAKKCIFRFYRDTRYSGNKSPYKDNFGAFINPGGRKSPYCGFYIHVEPGESFLAAGVIPDPQALKAIRRAIYKNPAPLKKILSARSFRRYFDGIAGEKLIRAPKGYPADFPDIDLLKPKRYGVVHYVPDRFWTEAGLEEKMLNIFQAAAPFSAFINKAIREEWAVKSSPKTR